MQKTSAQANDCPQRDRTESEWYEGYIILKSLLRDMRMILYVIVGVNRKLNRYMRN